jgi:hypothetical protein
VDREDWIPVKELRVGERLQANDRTTPRVLSLTVRADPEPVFNLEVEGDHCYRVGEQGLLVHNASCPNEILAGGAACALFPASFVGIQFLGFDSQARAKGVQARLCKDSSQTPPKLIGGGSPPSNNPQDFPKGWVEAGQMLLNRGDVTVRAHLLHEYLGGPGVSKNLVVTCKSVNSKMYADFESVVLGWVGAGSTVDFEVTVEYSGNSPYPKAIHVHAKRLNCQQSTTTNKPVCDEIFPVGGIQATIDITDCNGAIRR